VRYLSNKCIDQTPKSAAGAGSYRSGRRSCTRRWANEATRQRRTQLKAVQLLFLSAVLALAGCGGAGSINPTTSTAQPAPTASDLANRHGLHVASSTRTLPEKLSGLPWALYQSACLDSGFDLRPYRGQKVTFSSYLLTERYRGSLAVLWTITADGRVVGAYVTVDRLAPGIFSLDQAGAGFRP
jgi:hypothetical protein